MQTIHRDGTGYFWASLLLTGCLLWTEVQAQQAQEAWVQRYHSGTGNTRANAVAVGRNGNIAVTGYTGHYLTIQYSPSGVPLCTNRFNGPANSLDEPIAVVLDGSGNVLVTGYATGFQGLHDYATIAYSPSGVALWTNIYDGPVSGNDNPTAMAVDRNGNVFVTGWASLSGSNSCFATVAYSSNGAPIWTNLYSAPAGSDAPRAVAVDGAGDVFGTGMSTRADNNPDFLTIKYSNAGVPLWTNRYSEPESFGGAAQALAIDHNGDVIVAGYVGPSSDYDYATVKYSGTGVPLWTNRYNGGPWDQAAAVAVDGEGNVFVAGTSYASATGHDYTTVKYSAAGIPLWTNRYNGPGTNRVDRATAMAVDAAGNVYVTGESLRAGTSDSADFATVAYSNAGVALWTNRYNGPANGQELPSALAIAPDGVVVVGRSDSDPSTLISYDFTVVKYAARVSLTASLTNNAVLLAWPDTHTGWVLQVQTNPGGAWTNVAGSTLTNRIVFPADAEHLGAFFRLAYR